MQTVFYWNPFIFVGYRNDRFFLPKKFLHFECYATMPMLADAHISSVGDLCSLTFMHQSIPAAQPPRPNSRALAFIFPRMANSRGWRLLSCQIPWGEDEKRGQMPRPPSTLQHFSLIAQSNSAFLSILMCDFLFQVTSSFVIALGF